MDGLLIQGGLVLIVHLNSFNLNKITKEKSSELGTKWSLWNSTKGVLLMFDKSCTFQLDEMKH